MLRDQRLRYVLVGITIQIRTVPRNTTMNKAHIASLTILLAPPDEEVEENEVGDDLLMIPESTFRSQSLGDVCV
ncbi:hypothetical protein NL676_010656 [Syzygium grande]|nr:hypothetical protein NL676_010656 [Syzygium grande]